MKNKLLITTALVALSVSGNAYAQISDDININQDTVITAENQQNYITTGNIMISGGNVSASNTEGLSQLHDGSGQKEISIIGGSITLSNGAGIYADGKDGQYNTTAATMNITGGDITVKNGGEITLTGNADMNIGGSVKVTMDYTGVPLEEEKDIHDGGILHEGKEGDINISGGAINLTGEVAKIERGGFDSSWIYNKDGTSVMSEEEFYNKVGKYPDEASLDDFKTAGLNPDELDLEPYHVSTGDINISGGEINLKDGARISTTYKNEGNINISGGTINATNAEISNNGSGSLNITNGTVNAVNSELHGKGIEVSGGNITLNGTDFTNDDLSQSFKLTDGTIVMNGNHSVIGTNHGDGNGSTSGKFEMTGGSIKVNGSGNYIEGGDICVSGGTIDIAQGATLQSIATLDENDNPADAATLKLYGNDTKINLGGKLVANVGGNDQGKIHFQNSGAQIDGNVEDVSLIFENSHSLNNAISGNIGALDILAIDKGTLTFDKEPTGTITTVQVGNGATLDIGDKTLHSTGDKADGEGVIFADNSTLAFTVTDKDTYGKIKANYIKISENGTNLNMTLNGAALAKGETATFKLFNGADSAEAEVEGKFANLSQNSRYEFVDNGDGTFEVTSVGSATDAVVDAGGSANNAETAEAWDSVSASASSPVAAAVTEKLAQLSNSTNAAEQKAYVDALTAVAPEVAPMVQKTQTETANQVFGAVSTRLTGGSISTSGEGMASGDNIFKRGAMWVQGLFNKSKLDDTSKAKGFDADSNGIAFGAEKFVTDDTKVGIGYAYTNTDIDGFMRDTDVDTHTAILYGEYKPSNWYVNGIATYGWSDYEESKSVAGVGVKADYDVETLGLQAMAGYDMNVNGLGITPEAGLRYVHIKQDAYKDSADQRVSANDSDILTGVIGAKVSKSFELSNGMNIKPEARIAATYDLFNDDVNSVVTLANGSAYAVEGEALDRFGMELGAGVTAEVNDKVELSLGYEGKFREDYQDHTGLINAKYKF